MTKEDCLLVGCQILQNSNIPDYKISSEYILSKVLKVPHNDLNSIKEVSLKNFKKYLKLINDRSNHVPLDKILGFTEFYDLIFPYDKNTLTPRVETELLADRIIKDIKGMLKKSIEDLKVLDMCTGSGCLGLSIASAIRSKVTMSDISGKALKSAKKNFKINLNKIKSEVNFLLSDLFDNISEKYDIIVCNPPYIKSEDLSKLEIEVRDFDPVLALDGGKDGYVFYRKIIENLPKYLNTTNNLGVVYFEIGVGQSDEIVKMLSKDFEEIQVVKDYSGIERFIIAKKRDKDAK